MCRLALYRNFDSPYEIAWALAELEISYGGHGNGFWKSDEVKVRRGITLPVTDIAQSTSKTDLPVLFHTRLASIGGISTDLCHPFMVEGEHGSYVLAHNGHWSKHWKYSRANEKSDTQVAARLVGDHGPGVLLGPDFEFAGVFIVGDLLTEEVLMLRRSGDFYLQRYEGVAKKGPSYFHASEPLAALSHLRTHCYELPQGEFFRVKDDGRIRIVRGIQPVQVDTLRDSQPWVKDNRNGGYGRRYGFYQGAGWWTDTDEYVNDRDKAKEPANGNGNGSKDNGFERADGSFDETEYWAEMERNEVKELLRQGEIDEDEARDWLEQIKKDESYVGTDPSEWTCLTEGCGTITMSAYCSRCMVVKQHRALEAGDDSDKEAV